MTDEERKKKIVEIISPYVVERWHDKIADALIAAVIGDVKEVEHRAKFSERALHCLARSFAEAMCKYGDDTHYLADGFIQDAYSQAEKELEEEKNER